MRVALVVVSFNRNDDTLECLRSLLRMEPPAEKVHVVDNGSSPPLQEAIDGAGLPFRAIVHAENLGFTGGSNAAARRALAEGAEAVLFLNNDTVVDPGFLGPLVRALEADPSLGIVAPKIYFQGRDRVLWAYGARLDRLTGRSAHVGVGERDTGRYDARREADRLTGCAMLARREFIERVGLFDDRFFAYCEEIDWCLRGRRAGYRLGVVPDSVIWHRGHRTSGLLGRRFIGYLLARNHLLLLRKHSGSFVAGGGPALVYFAASTLWRILAGVAAWGATGDPRRLEEAEGMVRGIGDFWRGRFGRPPKGL